MCCAAAGWVSYSDQSGLRVEDRPRLDRHVAKAKFAEFIQSFHVEALDKDQESTEVYKYRCAPERWTNLVYGNPLITWH